MNELDEGRGQLKALQGGALFEVDYSVRFTTTLQMVRRGFPPVSRTTARVNYIRALHGTAIPAGQYLLERENETNRVQTFGGTEWHVLSWPT